MTVSLDVLYEDNHLLVVNKPVRLATMGTADGETLHSLAGEYIKRKYNKPHGVYVGIVSRLDSMTSGVIVLARTSKAADRLNKQFAAKSKSASPSGLQKEYWAIVRAEPNRSAQFADEGSWNDWLYKDEAAHRMRASVSPRDDAKVAELKYTTLHQSEELAVVSVLPITGRKHQIRVQFASRGFPVLGDRKYGSQSDWKEGIALHSRSLTIEHPTLKKMMTFECPPPPSWDRYWKIPS